MFPVSSVKNTPDAVCPDAELFPQRRRSVSPTSFDVSSSYFSYLLFCKLRGWVCFSFGLPSLDLPVCDVVELRSKKQVSWIDTDGTITVMANLNLRTDLLRVDEPRKTMGVFKDTF